MCRFPGVSPLQRGPACAGRLHTSTYENPPLAGVQNAAARGARLDRKSARRSASTGTRAIFPITIQNPLPIDEFYQSRSQPAPSCGAPALLPQHPKRGGADTSGRPLSPCCMGAPRNRRRRSLHAVTGTPERLTGARLVPHWPTRAGQRRRSGRPACLPCCRPGRQVSVAIGLCVLAATPSARTGERFRRPGSMGFAQASGANPPQSPAPAGDECAAPRRRYPRHPGGPPPAQRLVRVGWRCGASWRTSSTSCLEQLAALFCAAYACSLSACAVVKSSL